MDILTESEIQEINSKSRLVKKKYSEVIDRESAYEMLNKKIAVIDAEAAKIEQQRQEQKPRKQKLLKKKTDEIGKSVLKVLTSATFIRGALGFCRK
jgi:hypothetical protein